MLKKCTSLWREAHLEVKMYKTHHARATFGGLPVAGAVQEASSAEMFRAQGADFLRGVAFWRIKSSAMPRCYFVTGAAFRMTWTNFVVAGAVL